MLLVAAALALAGCATAVNDSLDRRGVDAQTMLAERVTTTRADALEASAQIRNAGAALGAIAELDGAALARQLDQARAAGQDAALAAQDFRLSVDTVKAAGERYFRQAEEELSLMKTGEEEIKAAEAKLAAVAGANRDFIAAADAAKLRLSPALSLHDAEVTALRRNATSRIAAEARASERASALRAAESAGDGLAAAAAAADRYLDALK
ncbi:MAG: hypothetical protein A3E78_13845 [Alphaproteobacteria bacterium RIFCSPHIGHO2_12_FULL_63_12]|nr:MAG: hypothetical protein A3E78_13845 [Alphaproteobacteria bacterium RIFCSPHIGHO2_12_FULL_63_12]